MNIRKSQCFSDKKGEDTKNVLLKITIERKY